MDLEGIDHVALSVRDVEKAAQWYIDVLGFKKLHEGMWDGVPIFIGLGTTALALFPIRGNPNGPARHAVAFGGGRERESKGTRMLHLALRANRKNFVAAQEELKQRGIKFEFEDHEISHSIYFRDPDGHRLEITTYELK